MKSTFYYFCLCALALLSSCSKSSGPFDVKVEYIPFQEEKNGLWGMISTNGEVLFSEEFKEEPTVVINGRFIVKNSDGLFEYYTAEKKPRKIGGEYVEATFFNDNVAPAVRKDKSVELIDMDGNVVCELEEAGGKRILQVSNFSEGIAVIKTSDGYGCINTSGEVVIKPHYADINTCSEGKIVAIDGKYKNVDLAESKITILDKEGNVTAEFGIGNLREVGDCFKDGLLSVVVDTDDGKESGLVNEKGEWVVKPSSKTRDISYVYDKNFVYYDGDSYGVKNIDGETVIRAKYSDLRFLSDNVLEFRNEKGEYGLIDINGNKLTDDTYEKLYGLFNDKYFVACTARNQWEIMDLDGNSLSKKTDIKDIGLKVGRWEINSHFFSYEALFKEAGISADAFGRLKPSMAAAETVAACVEKSVSEISPESYTGKNSVTYRVELLGCDVTVGAVFTDAMASYDGNGSYRFSDNKPAILSMMFPANGRISDKGQETFDAARAYVSKFSKLVKEDGDNIVFQTNNGKYILVMKNGNTTGLFIGENKVIGSFVGMQEPVTDNNVSEEDESFQPDNHPANAGTANGSFTALESLVSARKLTYDDISSLNKAQLRLLRNTIFARHGYIFKTDDMKKHFSQYSWYSPRHADVSGMMSDIEKYNVQFLKKYE